MVVLIAEFYCISFVFENDVFKNMFSDKDNFIRQKYSLRFYT